MATLCCFHAHPDDEAIATSGTMMRAVADGHRVVLVLATRGEQGEPRPGVLDPDEPLWQRRVAETHAAAELIGVDRVEFLGYEDSGMIGDPANEHPGSFWRADPDEAAGRLAVILAEEAVDVLTVYDPHGGYGHPDHIQVHRVGTRAAELTGTARVYWSTMNRTRIAEQMAANPEMSESFEDDPQPVDTETFGLPEEDLTHAVDVAAFIGRKREAMAAHASQIGPDDFFMMLPDDVFEMAFGIEWFVAPDRPRGTAPFATDLFG